MLIGIQLYNADALTMRRQRCAVEALRRLDGVDAVNVQFRWVTACSLPGIETAALLERDSLLVTGARGKRKPLAREMFDVLAARAAAGGHSHFAFINADIVVTPKAIEEIRTAERECYVIARTDVEDIATGAGASEMPLSSGLDMFVVSTEWWAANRRRFRDYAIGEMCWDCVYAAVMMCHAQTAILNRHALIFHERHAPTWHEPTPAARYNGMLAALDSRYFSQWVGYWERLEAMRARGASEAEEQALQRDAFVWRPSAYQAARQIVRSVRARRGYRRLRAEWDSAGA